MTIKSYRTVNLGQHIVQLLQGSYLLPLHNNIPDNLRMSGSLKINQILLGLPNKVSAIRSFRSLIHVYSIRQCAVFILDGNPRCAFFTPFIGSNPEIQPILPNDFGLRTGNPGSGIIQNRDFIINVRFQLDDNLSSCGL